MNALLIGLLALELAAMPPDEVVAQFEDGVYTYTGGEYKDEAFHYRLLKPKTIEPGRKYPLVLFLHGAGERGADNRLQLLYLPEQLAKPESREKYPCFLIAPQCRPEKQWVNVPWGDTKSTLPEQPSDQLNAAMGMLDDVLKKYPIDDKRVYLTGLSMGGYGVWDAAARWPERFSALAPICGGGDESTAARFAKLPIWAVHADADQAVPVARSRNMIAAVKQAGGAPIYVELKGVGHNSWTPGYGDPNGLVPWLFDQRKATAAPAAATSADSPAKPNIVLIFADDQGYGDAGCYGATDLDTPNLDRLAREGTRFTNFYVAQPVCTASRAALLSGCYSNRVGMAGALNHTSTVGLNPRETLVSELCRGQGYATAIYGKWHLGHQPPFLPTRQGFDEFFGIPYSNDNGPLHPVIRDIPALPLYENENVVERDPDQSQFTRRLTERAVRFIETNRSRPFFLYLPHIMPHVPIFASDGFRGQSRRGLYGDVIHELDWSVGQILAALEKHGLDERTLVIYTSDNGPFLSYGEHAGSAGPLREGKLTTFEGGVREPCLVRWPGKVPQGRVCDEIASTMDLCVTIAGLAGAKLPEAKLDGIDIAPLLFGRPGAKGRDVFWYYSADELHAVRQGDWKLHLPHEYLTVAGEPGKGGKPSNYGKLKPESIELSGIRGIASRHGYRVETIGLSLYNLKDDPGETKNVAQSHPEVVERLQLVAAAARAELGDSLTGAASKNIRPRGDTRQPAAE